MDVLTQDHINSLFSHEIERRKRDEAIYDRLLHNAVLHDLLDDLSHENE